MTAVRFYANEPVLSLVDLNAATEPERMVREARVALALLERFAGSMAECPEGRVYLTLIADTCGDAVDWARTHHCKVSCSATGAPREGVEQDGLPAPTPPGRAAQPHGGTA